jgi:aerobic carbon-monoxide dehydrogenase large subunit
LSLGSGVVTDAATGQALLPFAELGRVAYFRPDTLPAGFTPELMVTRHYAQRDYPFIFTNGVQASYVEVDTETGFVKLLKHWAVEDCGRVINPMLVDEQIRGAIVQGIGGALFEECLYDNAGLLQNGSMADYLVPMAGEMPDIVVAHVETPTSRHRGRPGRRGERHQRCAAPTECASMVSTRHARKDTSCSGLPVAR